MFFPPGQINSLETQPSGAFGSIFRLPMANVSKVLTDVVPTAIMRPVHALIASIVSCGIAARVKAHLTIRYVFFVGYNTAHRAF